MIAALVSTLGLVLFARAQLSENVVRDALAGVFFVGLGNGLASNPMILGAIRDVAPSQVGAASGIVSTSCAIGSSLGLSLATSIVATRTEHPIAF